MNIFGVGPLEVGLILLLALIIFGPKDIEKTGKAIGKSLNKLVRSESWHTMQQTGRELKNLPNRLMREFGMEEFKKITTDALENADKELKQTIAPDKDK